MTVGVTLLEEGTTGLSEVLPLDDGASGMELLEYDSTDEGTEAVTGLTGVDENTADVDSPGAELELELTMGYIVELKLP